MTNQQFIEQIGKAAVKYYPQYKILPSLTVAQAILESNWGRSGLSVDCHNYFGMKWVEGCGCDYKTYSTREQRSDGVYYTIQARFRKYPSLEAGIKGYYDFLQYPRYKNLKGVTNYVDACKLIRLDGWATSLTYTNNLIKLIETYNLTKFDKEALGGTKEEKKKEDKKESVSKKYYKKYTGKSVSLVDALKSIGVNSSMVNRRKIAKANGIKNYSGSAEQNTKLLELLKKGKLVKA